MSRDSFFEHISSKSHAHKVNVRIAIDWFEKFCIGKFDGKELNTILSDSMNQKINEPQKHSQNLFSLLQEFVNYLGKNGHDPSTIRNNFNLVKNYLNWYGFEIYSEAVKSRLNFPRKIEEEAYPITIEDIKKLLDNSVEHRKILYLFLSSTGLRILESMQIRKRDLELKKFDRIMVKIAGKYTKTGKPRKTFITKEVEKYLLPIINKKKDDDLLFGSSEIPLLSKHNEEDNFTRMRKRAGFGELRYDNGIHKITLHSFRSWFITKCNRIDSDFGNALAGHQKYMKRYNRFTEQELCDLFKRAEKTLSIFEKVDEDQEKKIDVLSKDLEKIKKENEFWKDSDKVKDIMKKAFQDSEISDASGVLLMKEMHQEMKALMKENEKLRKKQKPN